MSSEKGNAFLRPLKNKGFKEERVARMRLDNLSISTTLESNKSLLPYALSGRPLLTHARTTGVDHPEKEIVWTERHERGRTPSVRAASPRRR
jgi:hypothetical protein